MSAILDASALRSGKSRHSMSPALNSKSQTTISSVVSDFEDISLRDSLASASSTGPASPMNFFSDTSSTRSASSRDSASSVISAIVSDQDATKKTSSYDSTDSNSNSDEDQIAAPVTPEHLDQQPAQPRLNTYAIHSLKSKPSLSLITSQQSPTERPLSSAPPTAAPFLATRQFRKQSLDSLNGFLPPRNYGLGLSQSSLPSGRLNRRPSSDAAMYQSSQTSASANARMSAPMLARRNSRNVPLLRKALSTNHLPRMDSQMTVSSATSDLRLGESPPTKLKHSNSISKRISSEELEMRYEMEDNDDYDLPDDACMFNVPLSPALLAKSQKKPATTSPLSQNASQNRHNSRSRRSSAHKSPVIGRTSDLPSIKEAEAMITFRGMENLSDDARILTEKLKDIPDLDVLTPSKKSSSRRSSAASSGSTTPTRSGLTESATRPDGLPPKSPEEEQKHLHEFQKLIEKAAVLDKKKSEEAHNERERRAKEKARDEAEWRSKYLNAPDTSKALDQNYTVLREMWWRGIPVKYRESIWKERIGNGLNIDAQVYKTCLQRADRKRWLSLITSDVQQHTFPDLHIFGKECGPLYEDLINVLLAYSAFDNRMGYRRGLGIMAAMLVLNLKPLDAFIALCNMMANSSQSALLVAVFAKDEAALGTYYSSYLQVLDTKVPQLYQHFQSIKLSPATYLEPMLAEQFSRNLSLDVMHRIWDILVFEGDAILLRVALGVVFTLEPHLYGKREEVSNLLGWKSSTLDVGDEDRFMYKVREALKPTAA